MYDDMDYSGYDGAERVPDEIKNVRDTIMWDRTGRELLFLTGAMTMAALLSIVLFAVLKLTGRVFLIIPVLASVPFLAFGFLKPGGLALEDFLVIWWSNNINSAPTRMLSSTNYYERMQILALNKAQEKDNPKANKKGRKTSKKALKNKTEEKVSAAQDVPESNMEPEGINVGNSPEKPQAMANDNQKKKKSRKKPKSAYTIRY
ncbi:PrgI family protein [Clostridium sp. TM06-18]|nr:PrgI family protein [Clostridium sp. TM06-18]RHU37175.1 PrgI family protein [Clostridium sp. TM06-18]